MLYAGEMEKKVCPTCRTPRLPSEMPDGQAICFSCRRERGVPERREPQRPRVPCGRCNGTSFVRVLALRARLEEYKPLTPLALTFGEQLLHPIFGNGEPTSRIMPERRIGHIEAYVCRGCGHTELYVPDADQLPIGPQHGTELFEVAGDSPYR